MPHDEHTVDPIKFSPRPLRRFGTRYLLTFLRSSPEVHAQREMFDLLLPENGFFTGAACIITVALTSNRNFLKGEVMAYEGCQTIFQTPKREVLVLGFFIIKHFAVPL